MKTMNKTKIIVIALLVTSLSFSLWSHFTLRGYIRTQGSSIVAQSAAWQVLMSTFSAQDQQKFIDSVNSLLKTQ